MSLIETPQLTVEQIATVVDGARRSGCFMFMGNRVRIRGNAEGPLTSFTRMYQSFVVEETGPRDDELVITYQLEESPDGACLTLLADDEAYRVRDPEVGQWAFSLLTYLIVMRIRSHYIVHAGCVSRDGQGLVLSGDSRMGKTTLVSHLVTRGMGFLSDELAPIARDTACVDPFPRRLSIRPGPAEELLGDGMDAMVYASRFDFRTLVDVSDLAGRQPEGRVPLHAVVFLSLQPEGGVVTPMRFNGTMRVMLTGTSEAMESDISAIPGVTIDTLERDPDYPAFTLSVAEPATLLPALKEITERYGVEFAELRYEGIGDPDFDQEPRLVPIPVSAGVIELVKKMPGTFKRRLVEREFDGKLVSMMAELSSVVRDVNFYRLSPGRLEKMIEIVEGLP